MTRIAQDCYSQRIGVASDTSAPFCEPPILSIHPAPHADPLAVVAAPVASDRRCACAGVVLLLISLLAGSTGCRSHVYREVYQQKMQREIRTLEDQLYEADYHNQVLIDELERTQRKVEFQAAKRSRAMGGSGEPDGSENRLRRQPDEPANHTDTAPRSGQPRLPARPTQPDPFIDDPLPSSREATRPSPADDRDAVPADLEPPRIHVPPQIHVPPGPDDLSFPDVEFGVPVPPAGLAAIEELPPGHVTLPTSVQRHVIAPVYEPVSIRINLSRSGGYRFDDSDSPTGMQLTIEAIDERGELVDLSAFDIEGELNVVLLDPEQGAAEARLGRWDFDTEQLQPMLHTGNQSSALHVYLQWQDRQPQGDQVIAHVKLVAGEAQMQAQATLKTVETEIVGWNPRAEALER